MAPALWALLTHRLGTRQGFATPWQDLREITVFLRHEQDDLGEDYGYRLVAKEVIGVALCDVDDPYAMPEILDRDQAAELLGQGFVDNMESME